MRLHTPFVRLPIIFDAQRLAAEVDALPESAWRPHPEGAEGNTAVPLVAVNGDVDDEGTKGIMRPTPHLQVLPYTARVLASLDSVIGRTRLMRIEEEGELLLHVDTNYYWWEHLRVHVPVHTTPDVEFECGREKVHMAAGEVWVFDTWRRHGVLNPGKRPRTHLVCDTVGGPAVWEMIEQPERAAVLVDPDDPRPATLVTEAVNLSVVMTPWEIWRTFEDLLDQLTVINPELAARLDALLRPFTHAWRTTWALHGASQPGWAAYRKLLDNLVPAAIALLGDSVMPNGIAVSRAIRQLVLDVALNPDLGAQTTAQRRDPAAAATTRRVLPRIERPVIIVSAPRSGSSLLFETMSRAPELFTIGGESHGVIENVYELHPAAHQWDSNRLEADDATPEVVATLRTAFAQRLRDINGKTPTTRTVRMLEKTPKNALRVPFLAEAFPDAVFVYLYRDPRETISSMLDAWRSGRFVTYPKLPEWSGPPWSLVLTPGWRDLADRPLSEVVTSQWAATTSMLLDDLEALEPDRWCVASYDRLVNDPTEEIARIADFCDFEWDIEITEPLPNSKHTLESPHPEKWQKNANELEPEWGRVRDIAMRANEVFAAPPRIKPVRSRPSANAAPPTRRTPTAPGEGQPLRSVHTESFSGVLEALRASLLVSTYQSGHLVAFRMLDGALNTHFRRFPSPMGIARDATRMAVGTKQQIVIFQNQPALAAKLEPPDRHDACFVPRAAHVTGDIRVHDLAFAKDELWMVNTRFSCLATLDDNYSFVPKWRPPFITALAPEDRCHLNGLAVIDNEPKYVTALGTSNEPGGWREHKADGGVILDVDTGEPVVTGLCMPHSPRWHDNQLWVLESGRGSLSTVDLDAGTVQEVAQLPGFTRGLSFAGPYAFVGLSQVREHVFDGLPLTADGVERTAGVWVVDTRNGKIIAFLRFEGSVREVYEVVVLPGIVCPEIAEIGADILDGAFVLPNEALAEVPKAIRS